MISTAGSGGLTDLPAINPAQVLSVAEEEVRRAVQSFPAASSGGPDGMRPQHLKDLAFCRESGTDFFICPNRLSDVACQKSLKSANVSQSY